MREGRPFRFLAATLAGWAGLRAVLLWPAADDLVQRGAAAGVPAAVRVSPSNVLIAAAPPAVPRIILAPTPNPVPPSVSVASTWTGEPSERVAPAEPAMVGTAVAIAPLVRPIDQPSRPPAQTVVPSQPGPAIAGRWSGSAWAIARPTGTGGGLNASQLGGSQMGARLAYALGRARRVSIVGRVATPFEGRGREAALGVEWRPTRLPIRVFAEQRVALDRGRGGPSAGVIGGLYEALPHGVRIEAYGQAGVVGRDRIEGFADGAARATRTVAAVGPATLDLGLGAWGGAQRGAQRLDLGPTLGVAVPVGGRGVRLTLDYRARVAGAARPGSGPALSLGTDF